MPLILLKALFQKGGPQKNPKPETNFRKFAPEKMDGWKMIHLFISYWVSVYFQGRTISFWEGPPPENNAFLIRDDDHELVDGDVKLPARRPREN